MTLEEFVDAYLNGSMDRNTPENLQFYQNNASDIEDLLRKRASGNIKTPLKDIDSIKEPFFRESDHTYWKSPSMREEERLGGVTSSIGGYTKIDGLKASLADDGSIILDEVLKGASEKGTLAHTAVEEYVKNKISNGGNEEALQRAMEALKEDKKALVSFNHFLEFDRQHKPTYLASEKVLASKDGYAGTFDILAEMEGRTTLLDFKTTAKDTFHGVGKQTAAYVDLIKENTGYEGEIGRAVIWAPSGEESYQLLTEQNRPDIFKSQAEDLADFKDSFEDFKARGFIDKSVSMEEAEEIIAKSFDGKETIKMWAKGENGKVSPDAEAVEDFYQGIAEKEGYTVSKKSYTSGRYTQGRKKIPLGGASFGKSVAYVGGIGAIAGIGYTAFHNMTNKEEDKNSYIKAASIGTVIGGTIGGAFSKERLLTSMTNSIDDTIGSGYNAAKEGSRAARDMFTGTKVGKAATGGLAAAAGAAARKIGRI